MAISYAPSKTATRMWALTGATFTVPRNILVASLDTTPVTIPVPTYLIEHERGLVLFDTGCNPRAATDPEGVYGPLAAATNFKMAPEHTVDAQIRALGYRLEDVKIVIPSHLHFDHAGGLYLFPHARFYTMHGELQGAYWPPPNARGFFLVEDYLPTRNFDWFELPDDRFAEFAVAASRSFIGLPPQDLHRCLARWHEVGEGWETNLPEIERNLAAFGDAQRVRDGIRYRAEALGHRRWSDEPVRCRRLARWMGRIDRDAFADADEDVVHPPAQPIQVMHVAGRDDR